MSLLFRFVARPHPLKLSIGVGLGVSALLYTSNPLLSFRAQQAMRLDAAGGKDYFSKYQNEAKTPVVKGGRVNPHALRQFSLGSILGLVSGLAVSLLSKPLAVLLGLLFLGAQGLESRGISIIPYQRIQRTFTSIDVRSAIQDNVALKLAFGLTFALAGFAEF